MANTKVDLAQRAKLRLSAVIPVYNEEQSLGKIIPEIASGLKKSSLNEYEIIVVNDGSTDNSQAILNKLRRTQKIDNIVSHKINKGYGAALKTGIKLARHPYILIIDSDGSYPPNKIHKLVKEAKQFSMVVGARTRKGAKIPVTRIIPKKIVLSMANFLIGENIEDINSGMRIFRKSLAQEFWHLFPDKWSFTSTLTLSSHLSDYSVKYIPINYRKRTGKSTLKAFDFVYFLTLVIRLVVYFNPLKFFFWPGIVFTATGGAWIVFTLLTEQNITDTGILLFLTGMQVAFFGLIADLIVKTRESNEKTTD